MLTVHGLDTVQMTSLNEMVITDYYLIEIKSPAADMEHLGFDLCS